MNKSVLVLGSTGLIGRHLVNELIKNDVYKNIILLNRKSISIHHEKTMEFITDFKDISFVKYIIPVNSIFSCLGTTKKKTPNIEEYRFIEHEIPTKIIEAFKEKGLINTVHVVSAIGANAQSKNFYLKIKGELEDKINALEIEKTFIYQPSLLLGKRTNDFRMGERLAEIVLPLMHIFTKGSKAAYHAIKAEDVAKAMIYYDINMFINGSHTLTYNEMQMGL
jgi:nucleoside-diphosphate-sugar epimerase